jgi:hypothetical protein
VNDRRLAALGVFGLIVQNRAAPVTGFAPLAPHRWCG